MYRPHIAHCLAEARTAVEVGLAIGCLLLPHPAVNERHRGRQTQDNTRAKCPSELRFGGILTVNLNFLVRQPRTAFLDDSLGRQNRSSAGE